MTFGQRERKKVMLTDRNEHTTDRRAATCTTCLCVGVCHTCVGVKETM